MTGHSAYVFDLDGVVRDFAPGDASAAIGSALGRELGREQVWFTDDRAENVDAAREFGWAAEAFTLTRQGRLPAG